MRREVCEQQRPWCPSPVPGQTWRLRCFPYFFLLGVPQAESASLVQTMARYIPELTAGSLREFHYWELKRDRPPSMDGCGKPMTPMFSDYLDGFDFAAEDINTHSKPDPITGEPLHSFITADFTSTTLTNDFFWRQRPGNMDREEPAFLNAHYIRAIKPETKFIITLRDPIERLCSGYQLKVDLEKRLFPDYRQLDFGIQARDSVWAFESCARDKSARACAYNTSTFSVQSLLGKSLYDIFIYDWLEVFPRGQFLVIRQEDYRDDLLNTVQEIVSFLGVDPLTERHKAGLQQEQDWTNSHPQMAPHEELAMDADTLALLREFFRPHNHRLSQLLQDGRFAWGY